MNKIVFTITIKDPKETLKNKEYWKILVNNMKQEIERGTK